MGDYRGLGEVMGVRGFWDGGVGWGCGCLGDCMGVWGERVLQVS